ncbi:MAG TPA: cysteine desulfurase-like protein [Actinomycetota bacterium]|jgi:cysteine desulfurase family protein (TIGR01976 family)|nr:cysteine desulfurase-like protein [Actinomycetota bacterium]
MTDAPDLSALRRRFPALSRSHEGRPVVYADAPGGSQVPDAVIEAVSGQYRRGLSNMDGVFASSEELGSTVAAARRAGADLAGVDPSQVVFGPNSTSLLFHLSRSFARTIERGDEIVVSRLDHDANIRPWVLAARDSGASVSWVDVRPDDATLDLDSFEAALERGPRLVAFTLASNAVGTVTPAAGLVARAKAAGALVAVDGVHIAQHRSIDLSALGADIVSISPYKVFGPHLGMVAATPAVLDGWDPYRVRPAEHYSSPQRWETGTQNHEALAGFVAAVDYLAEIGATYGRPAGPSRRASVAAAYDAIGAHERRLADRFLDGLGRIEGLHLYGVGDRQRLAERTPTFAVRVGDRHPRETAKSLAERGIFVWDGHYYAIELFDRLGLLDQGGAVRVGFCHYHSVDEVDRVLQALADLA